MPIEAVRRWGAEGLLAVVAGAVFLGFLGSTELWGKREQRASAEALDTVDRGHWLVAEIQGRPRLEKPPLPRWIAASLITISGRRDEAIVRLPNVLAALATVFLVYHLGRRLGGRPVGLASGFALASMLYFVVEMRQAGNDGLLTLFTTLALLAAWERLHGDGLSAPGDLPGPRPWSIVFHLALGLGFLTKGPVVLLMAGLPVVGYLATARRLRSGLGLLLDARGLVLFAVLALAWPIPVLLRDPVAARVWWLEIGQKTGVSAIEHGNARGTLALDWFWMTMPWTPLALLAAAWPIRRSAREGRPRSGFAWWWSVGNLAALGLWSVAKPNYYVPCLPGVALMVGPEWVRLARLARSSARGSRSARFLIQGCWTALFVGAMVAPVAIGQVAPAALGWGMFGALGVGASVVVGAWAWRRGWDAGSMASLASGFALISMIGYGAIAPIENPSRGHRTLAEALSKVVPAGTPTVWFFDELDEGLWFYWEGHDLAPVSRDRARYNRGFDLHEAALARRVDTPARRLEVAREHLADWARHADPATPYILIRARIYDRMARDLAPLVEPVFREAGLKRNEMVLLRARTPGPVASAPSTRR
ncbi:ArnT family glycosyltransferase [Tundrisphaera lichenicola]|uniref:ArnT family glycosyltransferase n=1 Tax=Tundrisphaera lichenicola TaxID=2029860 RepID=UPI003EBF90EB